MHAVLRYTIPRNLMVTELQNLQFIALGMALEEACARVPMECL